MPQRHHAWIMQSHLPGGTEQHPDRIMVPWHYKSLPPLTGISTGLFIFAWHAQDTDHKTSCFCNACLPTEICYTYTLTLGWLTTICTNTHWCPHWSIIQKFFWITRLLFRHAPLGVCSTMHSAICRHQPPQRTVLGQVEARATLHITLM